MLELLSSAFDFNEDLKRALLQLQAQQRSSATAALRILHWLFLAQRTLFKIGILTFKAVVLSEPGSRNLKI